MSKKNEAIIVEPTTSVEETSTELVPIKSARSIVTSNKELRANLRELGNRRKILLEFIKGQLVLGVDYYEFEQSKKVRNPVTGVTSYEKEMKKILGKGAAEKIAMIYGINATFSKPELVPIGTDHAYTIVATFTDRTGKQVGQGQGSRLLSQDTSGKDNKIDPNKSLKMAKKSAYIDGVISACALSDLFTQDIEDMATPPPPAGAPTPPVTSPAQDENQEEPAPPKEEVMVFQVHALEQRTHKTGKLYDFMQTSIGKVMAWAPDHDVCEVGKTYRAKVFIKPVGGTSVAVCVEGTIEEVTKPS